MARMHNPPHPGEVLKDTVLSAGVTVTAFAQRLGVSRVMLSNIVNGHAAISADMALRLAAALTLARRIASPPTIPRSERELSIWPVSALRRSGRSARRRSSHNSDNRPCPPSSARTSSCAACCCHRLRRR